MGLIDSRKKLIEVPTGSGKVLHAGRTEYASKFHPNRLTSLGEDDRSVETFPTRLPDEEIMFEIPPERPDWASFFTIGIASREHFRRFLEDITSYA